jgi:hypothetical protein
LQDLIDIAVFALSRTVFSLPARKRLPALHTLFMRGIIDYEKNIIIKYLFVRPVRKLARMHDFGPVAQLVRAGDSSKWCVHAERHELNGMNSGKP